MSSTLPINVEPVQVELDEDKDQALLHIATLQAAFPGATAVYYYSHQLSHEANSLSAKEDKRGSRGLSISNGGVTAGTNGKNTAQKHHPSSFISLADNGKEDGHRCFVKFDGTHFHLHPSSGDGDPPTTRYFAQLHGCGAGAAAGRGARRSPSALGSYEQASKQFQHSVQLVERMMTASAASTTSQTAVSPTPSRPPITPMPAEDRLTPFEHQFAELTRIAQGKDAVIEAQRSEAARLREQVNAATEKVKLLEEGELAELRLRCAQQADELEMFRTLGREQESMCEEVKRMKEKLDEVEREGEAQMEELNSALSEKSAVIEELTADSARLRMELEAELTRINTLMAKLQESENFHAQKENEWTRKYACIVEEHQAEIAVKDETITSQKSQLVELAAMLEQIARENVELLLKKENESNGVLQEKT